MIRRRIAFLSVLLASALLSTAMPADAATIYRAGADLLANEIPDGSASNPNGRWSYGTAGSVGGAFALFNSIDDSIGGEHTNAWNGNVNFDGYLVNDTNKVAVIAVNADANPQSACCGLDATAPGKIFYHPGPTGAREYAVIRWTAPGAGSIDINADWLKGDTGLDRLTILKNGNAGAPIFDFQLTGGRGTNKNFNQAGIPVANGDTFDFMLGNGGTFGSNTVAFDATITYVPEPGSLLLGSIGIVGLALAARRRNSAR